LENSSASPWLCAFDEASYAVLDEATSALDEENEERLYLQLRATSSSLVSVSHRSTC